MPLNAFSDAIRLDPTNATANRGVGFSALKLRNPGEAVKPLETAARVQPVDRNLAMALASSLVSTHNPMRAAKIMQVYLAAHPSPVDEPAVNALGIALAHADASAAKGPVFAAAFKLYTQLDGDLDATQPGKKRWGIDWLPAAEADSKQQARQTAQKAVDDADTELQTATAAVNKAKIALTLSSKSQTTLQRRDKGVRAAEQNLESAQDQQRHAQMALDGANGDLAAAPSPDFPEEISLDGVEFSTNPTATVASVEPVAAATTAPPTTETQTSATDSSLPAHPAAPVKWHPGMPVTVDMNAAPPAATDAPPAAPADQHITRYGVAFAIAPDVLVTANSVIDGATDIEVETPQGHTIQAEVLRAHAGDGLALLKLKDANFPCLAIANGMASGQLTCVSFPDVDLFNPLAKVMPVMGSNPSDKWTVRFDTSPRLPGAPLMKDGVVVGVELTERDSDPAATPADTLKQLINLIEDDAKPGMQVTKDPRQAVMQITADR